MANKIVCAFISYYVLVLVPSLCVYNSLLFFPKNFYVMLLLICFFFFASILCRFRFFHCYFSMWFMCMRNICINDRHGLYSAVEKFNWRHNMWIITYVLIHGGVETRSYTHNMQISVSGYSIFMISHEIYDFFYFARSVFIELNFDRHFFSTNMHSLNFSSCKLVWTLFTMFQSNFFS